MDAASRVRCDLDFERAGRQSGYLQAPLSRNTAAWGLVEIPITVVKNGTGPTVLFTGGIHGDEYEGQIAISRLALDLDPAQIQGRVILMPMVNVPAALNDTRLNPVDGWDINRCFPGDPRGTFSPMLAHFLDAVILPMVDVSVDLHTAGHSNESVPSSSMHYLPDPAARQRTLDAAAAFGAPYNVVFGGVDEGGTLTSSVERRGILSLGTELGGWGRVSIEGMRIARRGLLNTLRHFGLMEGAPETSQRNGSAGTRHTMVLGPEYYVRAPADGVFEPCRPAGELVRGDDVAGWLHAVQDVDRAPQALRFRRDGMVWFSPGPGRVRRGDALYVLMADFDEKAFR